MLTLRSWVISTLAVLIAAYLIPGVMVSGLIVAFITSLLLGIINAFVRPVMIILTLPLTIVTLGLFTFVLNALLVLITSAIVPGFVVTGFWWALLFSLLVTIINSILVQIFADFPKK